MCLLTTTTASATSRGGFSGSAWARPGDFETTAWKSLSATAGDFSRDCGNVQEREGRELGMQRGMMIIRLGNTAAGSQATNDQINILSGHFWLYKNYGAIRPGSSDPRPISPLHIPPTHRATVQKDLHANPSLPPTHSPIESRASYAATHRQSSLRS